ncbi:MAG: hypothetical protein GY703_16065 [Gammaproteobacteria bacterium]|nr:hypothetical protein [Gammaproteobacteria bacterium]
MITRIAESIEVPGIEEIILPVSGRESEKEDEFGFVVLRDGSVGPFYTCLGDTLDKLAWCRSQGSTDGLSTLQTAMKLGDPELSVSALALGAFNALSQHIMRRAGFNPTDIPSPTSEFKGGRIGVVGYFPPLVKRYLAAGHRVTVIEKKPERVPDLPGIELHTSPDALSTCDSVICTASTLINGTIDHILEAAGPDAGIDLMGPSASGLPDPLFDRGIRSVGGILINQPVQLKKAVANGEKWSACGRKYQLGAMQYPGIGQLLAGSQ